MPSRRRGRKSRGRRGGGGRRVLSQFELALKERPETSSIRIVFPWSSDHFSRTEFNPVITQGVITERDADRVFSSIEKVKSYDPKISSCWVWMIPISFFGILGISILIYFATMTKEGRTNNWVNPVGMVIAIAVMMYIIFAGASKQSQRYKDREEEIKQVLDDFNRNEYDMKGVNWKVGKFGAWVLMDLNYIIQQQQQGGGVNNGMSMGINTGIAPVGGNNGTGLNMNNGYAPVAGINRYASFSGNTQMVPPADGQQYGKAMF